MADSRLERLAPLSGVGFFVLLIAGTLLINNYEFLPPSDEIKTFYEDNSMNVRIGGYVILTSAAFLVWFAGSLRVSLRDAEGGSGRLSAVSFGGGVAAAVTIMVAMCATIAAAARGGSDGGVGPETATTLFDLSAILMGTALPIAYAVMLGAAAVVSFRSGVFARWFTWVTAVLAVALLIPEINFAVTGLAVIWVVAASIFIYRTERTAS